MLPTLKVKATINSDKNVPFPLPPFDFLCRASDFFAISIVVATRKLGVRLLPCAWFDYRFLVSFPCSSHFASPLLSELSHRGMARLEPVYCIPI